RRGHARHWQPTRSPSRTDEVENLITKRGQLLGALLIDDLPTVIEQLLSRVDRYPKRGRPTAKRMHRGAQRHQRGSSRLPAVSAHDAPHRAPIQVRPLMIAKVLDVVQRILHQPRNP